MSPSVATSHKWSRKRNGCLARTRTYRNYNTRLVAMIVGPQLGPQENVPVWRNLSPVDMHVGSVLPCPSFVNDEIVQILMALTHLGTAAIRVFYTPHCWGESAC